jgi:hypothetical protein
MDILLKPGGDGGGAGTPAGGRRGVVGGRERLAGVARRDLLGPRSALRTRRHLLLRKHLLSTALFSYQRSLATPWLHYGIMRAFRIPVLRG